MREAIVVAVRGSTGLRDISRRFRDNHCFAFMNPVSGIALRHIPLGHCLCRLPSKRYAAWLQKKAADPKTDGQCLRSIASYPHRRGVRHRPRRTDTPLRRAWHGHWCISYVALFVRNTLVILLFVLRRLYLRTTADRAIATTYVSRDAPSVALHLFTVVGIRARVARHGNWGAARHAG